MPRNNLSQRLPGISDCIEILRAKSLGSPDNWGRDTFGEPWTAPGQSGRANYLIRGRGTIKAKQDASFEGNPACEPKKHLPLQLRLCLSGAFNRKSKLQTKFCNNLQVSLYRLQILQE